MVILLYANILVRQVLWEVSLSIVCFAAKGRKRERARRGGNSYMLASTLIRLPWLNSWTTSIESD